MSFSRSFNCRRPRPARFASWLPLRPSVVRFALTLIASLALASGCGPSEPDPAAGPTVSGPTSAQLSEWAARDQYALDQLEAREWQGADYEYTQILGEILSAYNGKPIQEPYPAAAVKALPTDYAAMFWNRGFARRNQMRYAAAATDYETALLLDEAYAPALRELALLNIDLRWPEKSISYLRRMTVAFERRRPLLEKDLRSLSNELGKTAPAAIASPDDAIHFINALARDLEDRKIVSDMEPALWERRMAQLSDARSNWESLKYGLFESAAILVRARLASAALDGSPATRDSKRKSADAALRQLAASHPDDPQTLALEALSHFNDGRFDDAKRRLDAAFAIAEARSVGLAYGYSLRGALQERAGEFDAAIESYNDALETLTLPVIDILLARARLYRYLGMSMNAETDYQSALNADPTRAEPWIGFAESQVSQGAYVGGLRILNMALAKEDDSPERTLIPDFTPAQLSELFVLRARCRLGQLLDADALNDLNSAVKHHSQNAFALSMRADLLAALGNASAAADDLVHWAAFDSESTEPLIRLSKLKLSAGDGQGALDAVNQALARDDADFPSIDARALAVVVLRSLGRFNDALAAADRLTDAAPELPDAWRLKARARAAVGDDAGAWSALKSAPEGNDRGVSVLCDVARYEMGQGDINSALKTLDQATMIALAANQPNDAPARMRAEIYFAAGQIPLAKQSADEAVKLSPFASASYVVRGLCHLLEGDDALASLDAEFALNNSIEDAPFRADALWLKALVKLKAGDLADATELLADAARRTNGEYAARDWLLCRALSNEPNAVWSGVIPFSGDRFALPLDRALFDALRTGKPDAARAESLVNAFASKTVLSPETLKAKALYVELVLSLASGKTADAAALRRKIIDLKTICVESAICESIEKFIEK